MNPYAYLSVIFIWGTTPLSIQWSAEGGSPFAAALVRMTLAIVAMAIIIPALRIRLPFHKTAIKIYAISTLGQGFAMILIYWSSSFLSSSLISLIFGLSPLITGLLVWLLYQERLSAVQLLSICIGFIGLAIVLFENLQLDLSGLGIHNTINNHSDSMISANTIKALLCNLSAAVLFCLSSILIKRTSENIELHPLAMAMGSSLFAFPFYVVAYAMGDVSLLDAEFTTKAKITIVYLAVLGSVVAPYCFYTVLKSSSESLTSLITIAAPVVALFLGAFLNNEAVGFIVLLGSSLVIMSLLLFNFEERMLSFFSKKSTR